MRIVALVVVALTAPASADKRVRLDVKTAEPEQAWQQGRATPFVVTVTGITRGPVRVDCHGSASSYVRAHDVRDGVATPAVADFPPRAIPKPESLQCSAYANDHWLASWSGTLAWPTTTLPDQRLTSLAAKRCGTRWCVDVAIDRSHPGTVGADLEVMCTLRNASSDPFFTEVAPWSRKSVETKAPLVQLQLDDAPGATVVRCSIDRGLYGNARYADADATNNETQVIVANAAATKAQLELVGIGGAAHVDPGCGTCSSFIPGSISFAMKLRNKGRDPIAGAGVRCKQVGSQFELRGAVGALAVGETRDVVVSIQRSSRVMQQLAGTRSMHCEAVLWDQVPTSPIRASAAVEFPGSP